MVSTVGGRAEISPRVRHSGAVTDITSPANPRVKWLQSLRKRSHRDAEQVTVVEGYAECSVALRSGATPSLLAFCPELVGPPDTGDGRPELVDRAHAAGAEIVTLGTAAFGRASYRESPDGWLLVVATPGRPLADLRVSATPLLLVAEAVEKPGNLGAMLRTADAAGVDAVVSADPVTDWGNPNVVRASKATVFTVPVAAATTDETLGWLHDHGVRIVIARPDASGSVYDSDLTGPLAVVVGAEHAGLTTAWSAAAAEPVSIPMHGSIDSLNVATSAAIILYEALRQRRHPRG